MMLGTTLAFLGELTSAQAHLEQGIAFSDLRKYPSMASRPGDPQVVGRSWLGYVLWWLGYPDQALDRNREALTLVREQSHPYSLASTLSFAARVHQFCREASLTRERAEAAMALATEHGFAQILAMGTILRGWALAEQGQGEEGIAQMHQGLAAYQAMGAGVGQSDFLALLAEAYGKAGQTEEGLGVLAEALAAVDKTGEHFYEPELYRLKGELTLAQSRVQSLASSAQKEAEACFQKAIEIAQRQQAKSLELRASTSLARLWQQQGKQKEAHELLAEIYGWFTEGFDTADLQDAKALLEELS